MSANSIAEQTLSSTRPNQSCQGCTQVAVICEKMTSFKTGGLNVGAVYDCGLVGKAFVNVGQRIAPAALDVGSPLIQGGNILNDN